MAKYAWIGLVILAAGFALQKGGLNLLTDLEGGQIDYVIALLALVGVYVLSVAGDYRGRGGQALRHSLIWLGLGLGLVTGYSYKAELADAANRVMSELAPAGYVMTVDTGQQGEKAVRLRRRDGAGFIARGEVNGAPLTLIVDTGATTVVLKPADAERAGIDINALNYSIPVDTANGTTFAASVRLRSIAVGPIELTDVEALVAKPGNLKENLLGMSFLKRLRSYEFSGDFLTLRG